MSYNFEKEQGETRFRHLVRVCVDKLNKQHDMSWDDIVNMFNIDISGGSLRRKAYGYKDFVDNEDMESLNDEEQIHYKETNEILSNGSHKSDKLLKMSAEDSKSVDYLLEAHGFDKGEWELLNAKNNIWNVYSKQDGVQSLYSSKITVKPIAGGFSIESLVDLINREVKPVIVEKKESNGKNLLEIPLFDMHFGVADLHYYKDTYNKISQKIQEKEWDTILLVIGQDMLHNDGFTGQTTSGTMIEQVNTEKAWQDADDFYSGLIELAIANSSQTDIVFSNGNHDQGISFGFVKMLEAKYKQANFDTRMKQRKAYVWKDLFIGLTHGDKGNKRISKNFLTDFGKDMAKAKIVEIHSGHLHREQLLDDFGIVLRTLSTGAKTDDWHDINGFVGSNKRFQLFEFSSDSLEAIYYV